MCIYMCVYVLVWFNDTKRNDTRDLSARISLCLGVNICCFCAYNRYNKYYLKWCRFLDEEEMGELQKSSQTVMHLKVPRKEDGKQELTVEIIAPLDCFHYLILVSFKSSKNASRWIFKIYKWRSKNLREMKYPKSHIQWMVELDQISQISDSVVFQTGNKISMTDGTECSFVGSSLRNCTMGRDGRAGMEKEVGRNGVKRNANTGISVC